ncbi:hypothetical protein BU24DRAFT_75593 [Aaosphaeria arxii CBS 175.79]|uniref:Uncharacterized protein n=1 Tax=Aaosphaeria arxii CBS 175.79 TaxID=1450172 RepID=A0A6A5X9N7_9PLEO|nr:uncharacterized protein BU24DRAFT_75593 [Aaosphaeria arxii CBS 175.79]KAF2009464.1 hypothetical protein BU24DRAFT_75593 [Aaosphaeria arxii CBS 175.79]
MRTRALHDTAQIERTPQRYGDNESKLSSTVERSSAILRGTFVSGYDEAIVCFGFATCLLLNIPWLFLDTACQ